MLLSKLSVHVSTHDQSAIHTLSFLVQTRAHRAKEGLERVRHVSRVHAALDNMQQGEVPIGSGEPRAHH